MDEKERGLHRQSWMKAALYFVLTFCLLPFYFRLPDGANVLCLHADGFIMLRTFGSVSVVVYQATGRLSKSTYKSS
jgi:hypothetical protein